MMTRRAVLHGAMTSAGALGLGALVPGALAAQRGGANAARPDYTLALARFLNRTPDQALPPRAIEHAKMIVASTFASAAAGSAIDSARILRQLAKEQGGRPDAPIWFDGTRVPAVAAARVNAVLSDAAASDDSDIRNTAHEGTTLTAAGLAVGERTGATGQELLGAMIMGYEAAGRIGEARTGGPGGLHASQIVAFAGAACAAKLMKLTDEQMAHALGIVATTIGGLATGTNSWAREYMGANAAACGVDAAMAAGRGYTVNEDTLGSRGGFVDVFGGGARTVDRLTADLGKDWDIVDFLAIKLWPGAHPFSGTVEAAMNAARQSAVAPDAVAKILVAGQNRHHGQGSRRPANLAEAIHSLSYYVAAAVADKDFTWAHATPAKILGSADHAAHGSGGGRSGAAVGHVQMELGRHRHHRHHVGRAVHEHGGCAARVRPARHRVERRGEQVPRAHARVEAAGAAPLPDPRSNSQPRRHEARRGIDASARPGTIAVGVRFSGYAETQRVDAAPDAVTWCRPT